MAWGFYLLWGVAIYLTLGLLTYIVFRLTPRIAANRRYPQEEKERFRLGELVECLLFWPLLIAVICVVIFVFIRLRVVNYLWLRQFSKNPSKYL